MNFSSSAKISCKFSSGVTNERTTLQNAADVLACMPSFCKQESREEDSLEKYLHHHCTPQVFLWCLLVTLSAFELQVLPDFLNFEFLAPKWVLMQFQAGRGNFPRVCLPLSWMICSATQHDPIFHPDFDRLQAGCSKCKDCNKAFLQHVDRVWFLPT